MYSLGGLVLEQWSSLVPGLVRLPLCPRATETLPQVEFVPPEAIVCVCVSLKGSDTAVRFEALSG